MGQCEGCGAAVRQWQSGSPGCMQLRWAAGSKAALPPTQPASQPTCFRWPYVAKRCRRCTTLDRSGSELVLSASCRGAAHKEGLCVSCGKPRQMQCCTMRKVQHPAGGNSSRPCWLWPAAHDSTNSTARHRTTPHTASTNAPAARGAAARLLPGCAWQGCDPAWLSAGRVRGRTPVERAATLWYVTCQCSMSRQGLAAGTCQLDTAADGTAGAPVHSRQPSARSSTHTSAQQAAQRPQQHPPRAGRARSS